MDCDDDVDDYCDVSQAHNLQILEQIVFPDNDVDQFLIVFEVEKTFPLVKHCEDEDEDEDDDEDEFGLSLGFAETKRFTFMVPCPRLKQRNLSRERISSMLSGVGVVLHKQEFMAEKISSAADEIANAPSNRDAKLLAILVDISIVACACYV